MAPDNFFDRVKNGIDNTFSRLKTGLVNTALKLMPDGEKICRVFLRTHPSALQRVVLMPVTQLFAKKIYQLMDHPKKKGRTWTGKIDKVPVSMVRQGMGAPATAVMLEVLHRTSCKTVIRVDYAGAVSSFLDIGDVVIPSVAYCGDGTTPHYWEDSKLGAETADARAPQQAIPTLRLRKLLVEAAGRVGVKVHGGKIWTTDALFRETPEKIQYWRQLGVESVDMESSAAFLLGNRYNLRVASLLAISDIPGHVDYDFIAGKKLHPRMDEGPRVALKILKEALPDIYAYSA